ncbi:MAG: hypothetical protein AAF500_05255 [Myxococcota bacterium]
MEVRIGYNKVMAAAFLAIGAINGFAAVLNPKVVQLVLAVGFAVAGFLFLRGEAAVVTEREVRVKNFLGGTVKRHPFDHLTDVSVEGKNILVKGERVVPGGMLRGADVQKLAEEIARATEGQA